MSSIISTIPVEIIEEIVNQVACIDAGEPDATFPNVKACSLICSALRPCTRTHIFRVVRLDHIDPIFASNNLSRPLSTLDKFAVLLTETPEIAGYVQELHYELMGTGVSEPLPVSYTSPPALERLTKLKSLTLRSMSLAPMFSWPNAHPSLCSILLRLMHLPTITSLCLKWIDNISPSALVPCTNLTTLHLILSRPNSLPSDQLVIPSHPIQLRELAIDDWSAVSANPFSIDPSKLKKIKVTNFRGALRHTAQILQTAVDLESLQIVSVVNEPSMLDVQRLISSTSCFLKTLRTLRIDKCIYKLNELDGVPQALKTVSGANCIESLTLYFDLEYIFRLADSASFEDWALLEKILLGPGWRSLKHINLTISNRTYTPVKAWEIVQERLPRISKLTSNGPLKFEYLEDIHKLKKIVYT